MFSRRFQLALVALMVFGIGFTGPTPTAGALGANQPYNGRVEQAARQYRLHVYESYRQDRGRFDQLLAAGQATLAAWRKAGSPSEATDSVCRWFQEAIAASNTNSPRNLPTIPTFPNVARSISPVKPVPVASYPAPSGPATSGAPSPQISITIPVPPRQESPPQQSGGLLAGLGNALVRASDPTPSEPPTAASTVDPSHEDRQTEPAAVQTDEPTHELTAIQSANTDDDAGGDDLKAHGAPQSTPLDQTPNGPTGQDNLQTRVETYHLALQYIHTVLDKESAPTSQQLAPLVDELKRQLPEADAIQADWSQAEAVGLLSVEQQAQPPLDVHPTIDRLRKAIADAKSRLEAGQDAKAADQPQQDDERQQLERLEAELAPAANRP